MRQMVVVFVAAVALVGMRPAIAQDPASSEAQVEAARAMVRAGALQIVREELELSEAQANEFWPLYDEYRAELLELDNTHVDLLRDFMQKYYGYNLTDEDAKRYVDVYFDIQDDTLKIRKKYVKRFRRVIGDINVMRLYQIENKLRAEVDAALAVTVPLAEPN